jgi:hypothetical protein
MGNQAGYQATSANNSNFFGIGAGRQHQVLEIQISLVIMLVVVQHLLIGQISLVKMLVM